MFKYLVVFSDGTQKHYNFHMDDDKQVNDVLDAVFGKYKITLVTRSM
jgi:hypothetical protein